MLFSSATEHPVDSSELSETMAETPSWTALMLIHSKDDGSL